MMQETHGPRNVDEGGKYAKKEQAMHQGYGNQMANRPGLGLVTLTARSPGPSGGDL